MHRFSTHDASLKMGIPGLGSSQQRRLAACAAAAPGGRGATDLRQGRWIRQGHLAAARAATGLAAAAVDSPMIFRCLEDRPWKYDGNMMLMIMIV